MTPLEWISDANLISALSHGVELDIESLCAMLEDSTRLDACGDARPRISADALHEYETTLMKILVHAWPLPLDPVVMALRECAKTGLARVPELSLAVSA